MFKYKLGEDVKLTSNKGTGALPLDAICIVKGRYFDFQNIPYYRLEYKGHAWYYAYESQLNIYTEQQIAMTAKQLKRTAVIETARRLLTANNTVTTLEMKAELRIQYPDFYWSQADVSQWMDSLASENKYSYTSTGNYRIYSFYKAPNTKTTNTKTKTVKTSKNVSGNVINRAKALDMIKNNKGHYFTATWTKTDGTVRTLNCQYSKDLNKVASNFIKVKSGTLADVKSINLNTLSELKIAGAVYTVK